MILKRGIYFRKEDKMKSKWKYLILLIGSFFLLGYSVYANEYILLYEIDPYYQSKIRGNEFTQSLSIMKINENIAYSLNPDQTPTQVIAPKDPEYLETLSEEKIKFMENVAYFGYDQNFPDKRKYMAAQELIWEEVSSYDIYWVDQNSEEVDLSEEKSKILEEINKMDKTPIFETNQVSGNFYEELILEDTNQVLDDFDIIHDSRNIVTKEGNTLKIKLKDENETTITLRKEMKNDIETAVFSPLNSPHFITLGLNKTVEKKITVSLNNKISAYLELQFLENEKPIKGSVKFKIRKDDAWIEYTTNENGYFLSSELFTKGSYDVSIIEVPKYSEVIQNNFIVTVNQDTIDENRTVHYSNVLEHKKGTYHLYRTGTLLNQKEMPLENVTYELYASKDIYDDEELMYKKGQKIKEIKTDIEGKLSIRDLLFGSYYLKEIEPVSFEPIKEKIYFDINEERTVLYEHINSGHLPLKIQIIEKNNDQYFLYDEKGNVIKELDSKDQNSLSLEYGKYQLKALRGDKILYTWDIDFQKGKDEYTYYVEDYLENIIFDMPQTGKKSSFSYWVLFLIISLLFKQKVKC